MKLSVRAVINWEKAETEKILVQQWPKIIKFLEYCPYQPCPTLREKVVMFRKLNGISLQALSTEIGISRKVIRRYELDKKVRKVFVAKIEKYYRFKIHE